MDITQQKHLRKQKARYGNHDPHKVRLLLLRQHQQTHEPLPGVRQFQMPPTERSCEVYRG